MRMIGKIISWIAAIFVLFLALLGGSGALSSIILFVTGAFLIPPLRQKLISKLSPNKYKAGFTPLIAIALVIFAIMVSPSSEVDVSDDASQGVVNEVTDADETEDLEEDGQKEESVASSEDLDEGNTEPAWKAAFSSELAAEIEQAFIEIGENPENIESIEYVATRETDLFDRRDYKVTFYKGGFLEPDTWVHERFYRITTQEWYEGEPERDIYPYEYLAAIKFWDESNKTPINQWAQNGMGKLQNSDYNITPPVDRNDINAAYCVSVSDLVAEINKDIDAAAKKYNGQWIEITGTVTYISEYDGMTGYYLLGKKGDSGLKIACWVDETDDTGLDIGETATFFGAMREVTLATNTEIGLCIIR